MEEIRRKRMISMIVLGIIWLIVYLIFWLASIWEDYFDYIWEFHVVAYGFLFILSVMTGINCIIDLLVEIGKNTKNLGKEVVTTQPHTINGDVSSLKKKRCDNCGYELSAAQNSCPNCGRKCN